MKRLGILTRLWRPAGMTRWIGVLLALLLPLGAAASANSTSSSGVFDLSFGTDGLTRIDLGGRSDAWTARILYQPDGKLVVVGGYNPGDAERMIVARFNPDGGPDGGFGQNGWNSLRFGVSTARAYDGVLQADGKIILAGKAYRPNTVYPDFALARFTASGSLDTTFGDQGLVFTDFGANDEDIAFTVALQPDGKILAGGVAYRSTGQPAPSDHQYFMAVARYTTNGSLDPTFDGDGLALLNQGGFNPSYNRVQDLLVLADGKIVAGGLLSNQAVVTRLNADGSVDAGFGVSGWRSLSDGLDTLSRLALQADGKIVAGGDHATQLGASTIAFARLLSEGGLDLAFDGDGYAEYIYPQYGSFTDLALLPGGKLGATFYSERSDPNGTGMLSDFGALRLNPDGGLDATFASAGWLAADYSPADTSSSLLALTDGRLMLAGDALNTAGSADLALARFSADGAPDPTFAANGLSLTGLSGGSDRMAAGLLAPDGAIYAAGSAYVGLRGYSGRWARFSAQGVPDPTLNVPATAAAFSQFNDLRWRDMARLPDGKLLLLGDGVAPAAAGRDLVLARYLPGGNLDADFGIDGFVTVDLLGDVTGMHWDYASRMLLLPGGQMIVVGSVYDDNFGFSDAVLARFDAGGNLDPTFGAGGAQTDHFTCDNAAFNALALTSGDKIVAAGRADCGGGNQFVVARYTAGGVLDTTFNTLGFTLTDFSPQPRPAARPGPERSLEQRAASAANPPTLPAGAFTQEALALAALPDGRIMAGGYVNDGAQGDFGLARYQIDGSLDPSFSLDGTLRQDFFGGYDQVNDLLLLPDGRIVAAGQAEVGSQKLFALARFAASGDLDANFAEAGLFSRDLGPDSRIMRLLRLPDDDYLAFGSAWNTQNTDLALARIPARQSAQVVEPGQSLAFGETGLAISRPAARPPVGQQPSFGCTYNVARHPYSQADSAQKLAVSWSVSGACATTAVDLIFSYTDAELAAAGITESQLRAAQQPEGGSAWAPVTGEVDPSGNTLTLRNVTPMGVWALVNGSPSGPVPLKIYLPLVVR